jgi:hypothetical protein
MSRKYSSARDYYGSGGLLEIIRLAWQFNYPMYFQGTDTQPEKSHAAYLQGGGAYNLDKTMFLKKEYFLWKKKQ